MDKHKQNCPHKLQGDFSQKGILSEEVYAYKFTEWPKTSKYVQPVHACVYCMSKYTIDTCTHTLCIGMLKVGLKQG